MKKKLTYKCNFYGCTVHLETYRLFDYRSEFYHKDKIKEVTKNVVEHICGYWERVIMRTCVDQMNFYKRRNPIAELYKFKPESRFIGTLKI